MALIVARPEIKAKELNKESQCQARKYEWVEVDALDSLVVHLGALNVRRHWRSQVPEFGHICGHTDVNALGVVI